MPIDYYAVAVKATRDYVVNCLENERWCEAQVAGKALKILVQNASEADAAEEVQETMELPTLGRTRPERR